MSETKNEELILKPQSLDDFLGQKKIKEDLIVYIKASKIKNEQFPHTIFYGGAGLGKTTLCTIVANEMEGNIIFVNAANIQKTGDLAKYIINLEKGDFLFIDEIHRLRIDVQELLYTAMEDYRLDIVGQHSETPIQLSLNPFTLIGATTMVGKLSKPLKDRFKIDLMLTDYTDDEICLIIKRTFTIRLKKFKKNIKLNDDAVSEIAKRSRHTPRIANNLIDRIIDFVLVENINEIKKEYVIQKMDRLGIDENGLKEEDLIVLRTLYYDLNNKPTGLDNLAVSTSLSKDNIENNIEPYLIKKKLIIRKRTGRIVSEKGEKLLIKKSTL